jgi:hypothetical protein
MTARTPAKTLLLAAFSVVMIGTSADAAKKSRPLRQTLADATVKDCTRFNGRIGYYGNPWCNAAEQARWDRWDAAQAKRR